jgi:putative ABC transport system substrate-binding protein
MTLMPSRADLTVLYRLGMIASLSLVLLAGPLVASAEAPRVGYLSMRSRSDPEVQALRDAFQQGLREHGYIVGQTLIIEPRFADGRLERLPELAAELVRLKVHLIFAETTPAARAAKQATATIPIVFNPIADPVSAGLVASLARPGANVTGLTQMAPELDGKRLELFKEAVPAMTRVGVLFQPGVPSEATVRIMLEETATAARAARVEVQRVEAHGPKDLDGPFAALSPDRVGGLIVLPSPMFLSERRRVVELTTENRLPGMFFSSEFVDAGGLMSYGPNFLELWRRAAVYVAKILKGAKPSELPVEQPTRFELVINLKTAKALGLKIPQSVLLRAERIIQ